MSETAPTLQEISEAIATRLQNTSDYLADLLNTVGNIMGHSTTLIDRTASGGGGSGFAYDAAVVAGDLAADHVAVLAALDELDTKVTNVDDLVITALSNQLSTLLHDVNEYADGTSSDVFTHDDENRSLIIERLDTHMQELSQHLENVRANLYNRVDFRASEIRNLQVDIKVEVLAAVAAGPTAVNDHIDDLRTSLGSDIQQIVYTSEDMVVGAVNTVGTGVTTDVNAHTDEVRTSLNADIENITATQTEDVLAGIATGVEDVNAYTAGRANSLEAAHLLTQEQLGDARTDILDAVAGVTAGDPAPIMARFDHVDETIAALQVDSTYTKTNVDNLPGVIELWAQDQGDRIYNRIVDWTEPHVTNSRDYVVSQGENQRDYVVQEVTNRVATVEAKVDENRLVLNAIHDELHDMAGGSGLPFSFNQVGETTFDGVTHWDQSADFFEVEFDAWPPGRAVIPLGDQSYLPHMGWCAFKMYGGYERGPLLEFSKNLIQGGKLQPQGLLVYCKPGTTGVIRAFAYS